MKELPTCTALILFDFPSEDSCLSECPSIFNTFAMWNQFSVNVVVVVNVVVFELTIPLSFPHTITSLLFALSFVLFF